MILNSENNKVHGVSSGRILPELFIQPTVRSQILFLDRRLVQDFFSYRYGLAGCFFFKITHPPTASLRSKMVDPLL